MADLDLQMARAIRDATAHTLEVATRPHVRAQSLHQRIGLFITALRRELGCIHCRDQREWKHLTKRLRHHTMWADVGCPRASVSYYSKGAAGANAVVLAKLEGYGVVTMDTVNEWANMAKFMAEEDPLVDTLQALRAIEQTTMPQLNALVKYTNELAKNSEQAAVAAQQLAETV